MIWRYESEGQGFESLSAHQRNRIATPNFGKQCGFFFCFAQVCSLFVRYGTRCSDFPSGNCEWKIGVSVGDHFQRMNLYTNTANKVAISKGACQLLIWIKRTYRIEIFIEMIVLQFRKETLYRNSV